MKTAMQQLIEIIDRTEKLLENENNLAMSSALFSAKNMAELLLKKEKEQIIDFTNEWFKDYLEGLDNYKTPEEYYDKTYNQNK
jgi:vacuolar-type H+-ATPase subunit E/Vma4